MSVGLPVQNDGWREALVAHTLWEGLVVRALVVNFVAELGEGDAILAFLIRLVFALAFGFDI